MHKEDIPQNISAIAFDFFYWFSRFEFALKENGYLKNPKVGENAEPGWNEFVKKWQDQYAASDEAASLLKAQPKRQIVAANNGLAWKDVDLSKCKSELAKVVCLLKTVRNNLFHGGKSGGEGWDNPERTALLLSSSKTVLDQLAELAAFEADYTQYY